jgi:2'-5' RNA ligase
VLWLDVVEGRDALARLHGLLGERLVTAGVAVEARPFSPHLTIARVPDRERSKVKLLRERLAVVPPSRIEWTARTVTLFRSDLSGAVPRYEALQEISLQ